MPSEIGRVVALGASNLTRGFHAVVSTARSEWGPNVEVLAALGHGRSYGARSRFVVRSLPGILQSEIWSRLSQLPPVPTRGLVTDVGNDILYGFPAARILAWVEEAVDRLQRFTDDVALTDLPVGATRQLSNARFLLFRSVFFPRCRLSLGEVIATSERVNQGLASLASSRRLRWCELKPEWYGFDPIHIRPSLWRPAWQEILCGEARGARESRAPAPWLEAWRLYFMRPERQWLWGVEQHSPQSGVVLPLGGKVWLY